jgi:hypothetical protein
MKGQLWRYDLEVQKPKPQSCQQTLVLHTMKNPAQVTSDQARQGEATCPPTGDPDITAGIWKTRYCIFFIQQCFATQT